LYSTILKAFGVIELTDKEIIKEVPSLGINCSLKIFFLE